MQNATIIAKPKVIVVITAADLQGLQVSPILLILILIVSTPLDAQKEECESADREETAKVINSSKDLSLSQTKRVYSRRRPIKDEKHDECSAVDNE